MTAWKSYWEVGKKLSTEKEKTGQQCRMEALHEAGPHRFIGWAVLFCTVIYC